jgi:ubiquinone/menaquinone biosynthesis C-methylase UbiE
MSPVYFLHTGYLHTFERVNPDFPDANFQNHYKVYEFVRQLSIGKDVLDLGCGTGYGTAHLARAARSIVGIDNSRAAIKFARNRYSGISFLQMDAQKLNFPQESFDLIVSSETLEHVHDQSRSLEEIRRVLRRDGLLFLATPNPEMFVGKFNPYHVKENTHAELRRLLEYYFSRAVILENLLQPPTKKGQAARRRRFNLGDHGLVAGDSLEVFGRRLDTTHLSNTHSFFCFAREPRPAEL